jgi:tripartite-type tricarboxylate transporter receptor subunit TctC
MINTKPTQRTCFIVFYSFFFLALGLGFVLSTWAQDFPNRPIRLIVPYSPGGVTDITARTVSTRLSEALGQSVVVDNRAGGASIVGTDAVVKAKPDGYTLLLTSSALAANHILFKNIPYDPVKDLLSVSFLTTVPTVLVVPDANPIQNIKELVFQAKTKPDSMNYGSAGNGSGNHLTAEVFQNAAGIHVQHIPYKGGGAVMADLVAGHITFVFAVLPTAYPFITTGKLRALAVSSSSRNSALSDVPTVAESGYPGFSVTEWVGVFAPNNTPQAVIDKLNAAFNTTLKHHEVQTRLKALGSDVIGGAPSQLDSYLRTEVGKWSKLAEKVKFEVVD